MAVEVRVSASSSSKSSADRRGVRARAVPEHRVEHRPLDVDAARVPEAPAAGRAGRLGQAARPRARVAPLPVALERLEQLAPAPARRACGRRWAVTRRPPALAGQQPGLLEGPLDLLQPPEVAHGVVAQRSAQGLLVDVVEPRARVVAAHRPLQVLEVVEPLQRVDRGLQRHGVLAARPTPGRPTASPGTGRPARRPAGPPRTARSMSPITCRASSSSSRRRSGGSDASSRDIAAIRRAMFSSSSSRVLGLSGNRSPYRVMNVVELRLRVLAPLPRVDHRVELGEHVLHRASCLRRSCRCRFWPSWRKYAPRTCSWSICISSPNCSAA